MENNENKNEKLEASEQGNKFVNTMKKVGLAIAGFFKKVWSYIVKGCKTVWRWIKRMFWGASKELSADGALDVEKLESPSKLAIKRFFSKKPALIATIVMICMFGLAFLGPLFLPMDVNYSDASQKNLPPNMSLRSVDSDIKKDIKYIDSFSSMTVGVSNSGKMRMWGVTDGIYSDFNELPEHLDKDNVLLASAGQDHMIAVDKNGKVFGWGLDTNGQYGKSEEDSVVPMPEEIINNGVDPNKVQQLVCGYQVTGLVVDSHLYVWGNKKTILNLVEVSEAPYINNVKKVAFSSYYCISLLNDGKVEGIGSQECYTTERMADGTFKRYSNVLDFLSTKTVVDMACSDNVYYFITSDNIIAAAGAFNYGENVFPEIGAGENVTSIAAGKKHVAISTDANKIYAWGYNDSGQCDCNGAKGAKVFAGSKQTYVVDENNKLIKAYGLSGYLMGTDGNGRDVWTRIIHGGKMTLTIGAVAVVISTIIAIIIGCLSGYFGGWVDMLLMRLSEIVGAIPFLPFAMMLSHVLTYTSIGETTRIFIIMLILGVLGWTSLAHMIRGQVLAEREKDFVLAARAMGVKETKIAFKHILPNIISVVLVSVTLDFAGCLLTESSLSYLGFGVQEPRATWGNMLNAAKSYTTIVTMWWQWVFPAIFLGIATICINIIGDALRDVLDPKGSSER